MASNPTFEEDGYEVVRNNADKDKSGEYAEIQTRGRTGGHAAYSKSFLVCLVLIILVVLVIVFGTGFGAAYGLFKPNAGQVQSDVDECASNPCQNGANCSTGVNGYQCRCSAGYTGTMCNMDADECTSNPCQNGATCVTVFNGYQCICAAGYTGGTCYLGIDECASNPCPTGSVCSDGIGRYTCICVPNTMTHQDCDEIRIAKCSTSDVYTVTPSGGKPTQVYCDMETDGGGWLVFQNRFDGSLDFDLNWRSYVDGFGDLNGEFWLGNHNLHLLTQQKDYSLRVELGDWEGNQSYAHYSRFAVASEQENFNLTLGTHGGSAGNGMAHNSGTQFSTSDNDNDLLGSDNCVVLYGGGGWWYGACSKTNLNDRYYSGGTYTRASAYPDGVRWYLWRSQWYSLRTTRMMIRPAP